MKVHHLNTATLCPLSARLVNGKGSLFGRARLVCHVLLVERPNGLLLVDTGIGQDDVADSARLGPAWVRQVAPRLDMQETALAQLPALGFAPADVRDIAVTHLDLDHAGGIADFPDARIHVRTEERDAALARVGTLGQRRYRPGHFAHGPRFASFEPGGERWFGFDGVRQLFPGDPDVLLVPLPGHTMGHTGVAVRTGERWLLHAGDAYFHHGQVRTPPHAPWVLRIFQRRADAHRGLREANQERLRVLAAEHGNEVSIFCAHDPVEMDAFVDHGSRMNG